MTRIIDFHAHLDERWLHVKCDTPADVVRNLDRCGVEAACVFTIMGFYEDCVAHNEALLERANAFPDRLIPFVTVDPKQGRAAVDELERRLSNPRFRGVKFHPWLQAFASSMLRDTMMDILHVAADRQAPILLHDGTPRYSTTFQVAELTERQPITSQQQPGRLSPACKGEVDDNLPSSDRLRRGRAERPPPSDPWQLTV
jgi:hypothetical protein